MGSSVGSGLAARLSLSSAGRQAAATPDLSSSPAPPVEAVLGGRQSPVGYIAEHDVLGCDKARALEPFYAAAFRFPRAYACRDSPCERARGGGSP